VTIPDLKPGEAVAVDWTEQDYFADRTCLTRSSLMYMGRDPGGFHRYWHLGEPWDGGSSDAMALGTNAHLAVLQPQEWARRTGIPKIPRPDGARKSAKARTRERCLWEDWQKAVQRREELMRQIPDRVDVSLAEYGQVQQLAAAIWSHDEAAVLLSAPGTPEHTLIWREPRHGLLIKCRLDRYTELELVHTYGTKLDPGPAVVDIKTSRDLRPRPFWRSVVQHGYDIQDALYSDAAAALLGQQPNYYIVAAQTDPIRRRAVFRLGADELSQGRARYLELLDEYVRRRDEDDWLSPWERGVYTLTRS
jgi:hypothetical protein